MFPSIGCLTTLLGLVAAGQIDLRDKSFAPAERAGIAPAPRQAGEGAVDTKRIELAQASPKTPRSATPPARLPNKTAQSESLITNDWALYGSRLIFIHNSSALRHWNNNEDLTLRPSAAQKQKLVSKCPMALRLNDRHDVTFRIGVKDDVATISVEEPLAKGKRVSSFSAKIPTEEDLAKLKATPHKLELTTTQRTEAPANTQVASSKSPASPPKKPEAPFAVTPSREKLEALPETVQRYLKGRTLEGIGTINTVEDQFKASVFIGPNVDSALLHDYGVKWRDRDQKAEGSRPHFEIVSPSGELSAAPMPIGVRAVTFDRVGENLRFELFYVFPDPGLPAKRTTLIIQPDRNSSGEVVVDIN